MSNSVVSNFLVDLGFKGKLLSDMLFLLKSENDLHDFRNFIILNDGCFKTNLQLHSMYVENLKKENNYKKENFVNDFHVSKKEALEKYLLCQVDSLLLNKVEKVLENGLTPSILYDKLEEYQQYNPVQAVRLILLGK